MKLPIGYDNFAKIIENKLYFVDKSLFIKDIVDDATETIIIIRPRRFGKTLNLSMLQCFFADEISGRSTKGLFDNLAISLAGEAYTQHKGKYPVIFITLKDVKATNFDQAHQNIIELMSDVYAEHMVLEKSTALSDRDKTIFKSILNTEANESTLRNALKHLSKFLFLHYGTKPYLLIDEYDTPIQSAYIHGYFKEMTELLQGLFSAALKTNPSLNRAVVTGILRVAKENLFSGLNNLKVYSLLNNKYSEYFGFTEHEVAHILQQSHLLEKADSIRAWYNGYLMGNTVIYNPWSIVNCVHEEGKLAPYWVNTSDNQIIKNLLASSSATFKQTFEALLQDKALEYIIDENMVYGDLFIQEDAAWSLLLMSGYLKVVEQRLENGKLFCQLKIPNLEIGTLYLKIIETWFANGHGLNWYNAFLEHLLSGQLDLFERELREILEEIVSVHDTAKKSENFYHGLMLGLTASLRYDKNYELYSNKESGYGRYDYLIVCKDKTRPTLLLEFKKVDAGKTPEDLDEKLTQAAHEALKQIATHQYMAQAKQQGSEKIIKIAMAFCGRQFFMLSE